MSRLSEGQAGRRGYAARLLVEGQSVASGWRGLLGLSQAAVLGGLSAAAAVAWRALAGHPVAQVAVAGYLACEAAFYVVGKLRFRHLSRLPDSGPDTTRLAQHFERFLQLRDVMCIRLFLSGWFMGASAEEVLRGNVEDFVAYGFHCRLLHDLSEKEQAAIRSFVDEVEAAWGVTFQPGFNEELTFMAHAWEPLRAYHKPLILFALTEALARTAHALMFLMGFRPGRQGLFSYWHAPALQGSTGSSPFGAAAPGEQQPLSPPPLSPPPAAGLSLRRHSTSDAVAEAVHVAAERVHRGAEHALDATLAVTSAAVAQVAAQHPHGGPTPLSPRAPSPAGLRPLSPAPAWATGSAAAEHLEPAVAAAAAAAGPAALRRRRKGDSAADYTGSVLHAAAAEASAAAAGAVEDALPQAGVEPAIPAAGVGSRGRSAAAARNCDSAGGSADAEAACPAGPAARLAPLDLPSGPAADPAWHQQQAAGGASPADSAGSVGGRAGGRSGGGTRPDVPIVFLHGVGFGVLPYLHLVRDIQHACGQTPILMVEVPHVALRLCWEAQAVDDVADAVAAMLRRHGYRRACIVGHSYGTFVASRLCQMHPELVHSACVLDPVCMLTCYPQLLFNFIYKEPSTANFTSVGGAVDLIRFMCSRDLTIAQAFCRKFHWSELMLWPQDLPRRSLVVLSGRDDLVPSELVLAHMKLTGHPAKVMHHPELGHGGILLDPAWQAAFVANLRELLVC